MNYENTSYDLAPKADDKPMELTFRNISAVVQDQDHQEIIHSLSGNIPPGSFMALIGPSGCGKTTLLSILSGRYVADNVKTYGQILDVNEHGNKIGFVNQEDLLMPTLTPREAFRFVINLRIPELSEQDRELKVQQTIQKLGLSKCADTYIGNNIIRGISGGQKKRTAIGCQLLVNPKILFMDQPTTGLDSTTAYNIMLFAKDLAKEGCSIVSTIHQPSSQLFQLFEQLILMCEGYMIYSGQKNKTSLMFEQMGYKLPPFTNPCDFYLKILNKEGFSNTLTQTEEDIERNYHQRVQLLRKYYEKGNLNASCTLSTKLEKDNGQQKASYCTAFSEIFTRSIKTQIRNPLDLKLKIIQAVFQSIFCSILYYQKSSDILVNYRNVEGALFFISMTICFMGTIGSVGVFTLQRGTFIRQRLSNLYSTSRYYLALSLAYVPLQILISTIFALITYFACNLTIDADRFFTFYFISLITTFSSSSLGLFFGVVFKNYEVVSALITILVIPFMLVAGFYSSQVPDFMLWLLNTSIFQFSFAAYVNNQFRGNQSCLNVKTNQFYSCSKVQTDFPRITLGLWENIGVMGIFIVGLRVISYILLEFISNPKRNKLLPVTQKVQYVQ